MDNKLTRAFEMAKRRNEQQTEADLREAERKGRLMEGVSPFDTVAQYLKEDDELIDQAWKDPAIHELLVTRGLNRDGLNDIFTNLKLAGSTLFVAEQVVTHSDFLGEYFQLVGEVADPDNPKFKWATAQLVGRVRGLRSDE